MAQSEFAAEVTSRRVLRIWWALVWRAVIWGVLVGAVLGFIAGFVAGMIGRRDMSAVAGGVAGYLGSIPVSYLILRHVLRKEYGTFVVRMVSR